MILNQAALKRQVTVLALLVVIVIAGVYCYVTLPRESFPDITIPYVFVTTTYEGVAPQDMEELITIPIERKLKGIDNVEEIRSTSAEGISTVAIKFLPKVDLDDAVQKVRDKVDQAKNDLPADLADDPSIQEVNFSDMPVIRVVLSGPFSLRRLYPAPSVCAGCKTWRKICRIKLSLLPGFWKPASAAGWSVKFMWNSIWTVWVPIMCLFPVSSIP
jgi:multidrug efflux pump subunit AcrB